MGCSSMEQLLAVSAMPSSSMSDAARQLAAFSLFDWLVCARAGADQELSRIMRDFVREEGGKPVATIVGERDKYPARAAALANGTISHALDYDDTHFAHIGHLSVGIYPAALAAAEETNASAIEMRDAFLAGAEAACRIGMVLGRIHYQRGFHQTATAGEYWGHRRRRAAASLDHESDAQCLEPCRHPRFRPQVAIWDDGEAVQRRHRRRQRSGSGEPCEARLRLLRGWHSRPPGPCCHAFR